LRGEEGEYKTGNRALDLRKGADYNEKKTADYVNSPQGGGKGRERKRAMPNSARRRQLKRGTKGLGNNTTKRALRNGSNSVLLKEGHKKGQRTDADKAIFKKSSPTSRKTRETSHELGWEVTPVRGARRDEEHTLS